MLISGWQLSPFSVKFRNCAFLAQRNEMDNHRNRKATCWRLDDMPASSPENWYDMVTGVNPNLSRYNWIRGTKTLESFIDSDHDHTEDDQTEPYVTQMMIAITRVSKNIQKITQKQASLNSSTDIKKAQRTVRVWAPQLNHLRPLQNNHRTDKTQLLLLFASRREDVLHNGQTIQRTTDTSLRDVLTTFSEEYSQEDFREVWCSPLDKRKQERSSRTVFLSS